MAKDEAKAPEEGGGELTARRLLERAERVSELQRLQAAIRERGEVSDQVLENVPGGMVLISREGAILKANPEAVRFLGLSYDELAQRFLVDFRGETYWEDGSPCPPEDYPVSRCLATGAPQPAVTIGVARPGGEVGWAVFSATPVTEPGSGEVLGAVVTLVDVSHRRATEEALRRSEGHLRTVLETSPDHIMVVDREARLLYINRVAEEVGDQEVIGRPCYDFLPPEMHQRLRDALEAAFGEGKASRYETSSIFGRTYASRVAPMPSVEDSVDTAILIATDVTETREAEAEASRLRERILEAQRLESLALLAGGVAHDFNNLLLGVLGRTELALRRTEDPALREHLEAARTASLRAKGLTDQLLAYSGGGAIVVTPLDLNSVIRETLQLLEVSISRRAILKLSLQDDLPGVEGDASQLQRVVMNLVVNASEAVGDRTGRVKVLTREATPEEAQAATHTAGLREAEAYVLLEVSDPGCGMSQETMARIFDPFFTTKFTGRGLGLAAVLGIVRGHGGALEVTSAEDKGSIFRVYLPSLGHLVVPEPRARDPREAAAPSPASGPVLVVDDEHHIRAVTEAILVEHGYQVLTASDGVEALKVLAEERGVSVVILDLLMPNMDGEEALTALREQRPELPVILSSGYGEDVATRRIQRSEFSGFLKKPYSLDELVNAVRDAITG